MPKGIYYSKEKCDQIVHDYRSGLSSVALANKWNMPAGSVFAILKRRRIQRRAYGRPKLTRGRRWHLRSAYVRGLSLRKVGKQFGVSHASVYAYLKRQKIRIRPAKKCRVNTTAFSKPSEARDYWLGFLLADGCVSYVVDAQPALVVHLAKRDVGHLRLFRRFLGSTHTIGIKKNSVIFQVRSHTLCEPIARLRAGRISGSLQTSRDFWRGVIDGDGSLAIMPAYGVWKTPFAILHLCGTKEILHRFLRFANRHVKTSRRPSKIKRANAYQVSFTHRSARELVSVLYRNCHVSLSRKQRIANKIIFPVISH